jgi:ribulose-bisphosphate carboxylase large chain
MYFQLGFKPNYKKYIIATFYIESKNSLREVAEEVAAESSIGTWTELVTLKQTVAKQLAPKIFYLNYKTGIAKIAYPLDLFEPGNIPQLLSSVGGNIFGMKILKNLRLQDLDLPEKYVKSFLGPAFGIDGVRKFLNIKRRPVVGCIMKPKLGLSSSEHAQLAYLMWKNGVDSIKDDENLTDISFNRFEDRVKKVIAAKRKAEKETGRRKIHVFNITASPDEMLKRAKLVKKFGGECVMIDIVTSGLGSVEFIRRQNLGLILHGHRAGHATFTRNPKHGISMLVIAKLARLAGIDELHTGTWVGKMAGPKEELKEINNFLKSKWYGIKPVMPVASGGLHPRLVPKLVDLVGCDVIINAGGGIHGHPSGSEAGARAMVLAVEAVEKRVPLQTYAKIHKELQEALDYWK